MIQNKITLFQQILKIYKSRVLIAANNNVYRTIRKKIFAVFLQYKISKVQKDINAY